MRAVALMLTALLAACSGDSDVAAPDRPIDLETAAIERGLVRDPKDTEIAGLYARDTDRVCVVAERGAYRIGAYVDYGEQVTCSGSGRATRVGETLHIEFDKAEACSFDAKFDGERIVFPGRVPDACASLCTRRASFAALEVARLSQSPSEAAALRDSRGQLLCRSDGLR